MNSDRATIDRLASRNAALQQAIDEIMADAERRAAPLRTQLQRNTIALEVIQEIGPAQSVLTGLAAASPPAPPQRGRSTIKGAMIDELSKSALPLSKTELADRIRSAGHTITDATIVTIGSTLSRMVKEGTLVKAGGGRYQIKAGALPTEGAIQP